MLRETWDKIWYDCNESTYTVIVTFDNVRAAENFRRFVNRRFPGFTYRRGNEVVIRPMKPSVARSLMAAAGRIGEITYSPITHNPV